MPVDIRKPLKKFLPHLVAARAQNLNEADTVQRIMKTFEVVLGYDVMTELTREMNLKDKYVDLAVKLDGRIRLLIEVKAAGIDLRDRHIEQAERYAAENNIRWVVLTNGLTWNLYHLTFEEGIEYSRAFSIDVSDAAKFEDCATCFALLHRQSVRKDSLEAFWAQRVAMSPASISRSLFHEDTLRLLRRQIRKREDLSVDEEDLAKALHEMLSVEARELIGPVKIHRTRAPRARKKTADIVTGEEGRIPHEESE